MTEFRLYSASFVLSLVLVFAFVGCGRKEIPPPEPLPAAELPAAFEQAFASAKPAAKEQVDQMLAAFQAKDYPKALFIMQNLMVLPELTPEQSQILGRGSLTLNGLLQEAQAQGDQKAEQALKYYQQTK